MEPQLNSLWITNHFKEGVAKGMCPVLGRIAVLRMYSRWGLLLPTK